MVITKLIQLLNKYNVIGRTGELSRAPEVGLGLRGLRFRNRALGPRKLITK